MSPFGHPMQVSTQAQLASSCKYLPVRLTKALGLSSTLIRHEKETFGKRSLNWRNLKVPAFRFHLDRKQF